MATTKALELGQLGSKLTVHNENITLDGTVHGQYAGFDSDFTNALSSNISVTGNISVSGTVDGRDVATDGTKLDGIETAATADQTKADIEGLGIDVPATNLTGTIPAARLSTATTQAESDDSTKIATTAYVVDKITTLIGGAPSTLNDLNELAAAINDDANYNSTLTTALATKLPLAGGAITGNVTFGDNNKAIFGAGSDLEIYHDGSNSYITDNGTGNLRLKATSLRVQSASGNTYLNATNGGSVDIFHNNTQKLATTSTGIDVTGGINYTSGTLNYTGTSVPTGANNQGLYVPSYAIGLGGTYASLNFPTTSGAPTTTAWWMLGRAGGSNDQFTLRVRRGGTAAADQTAYVVTTSGADSAKIVDSHKWYTGGSNGTERMRIDSSGNVGIGNTSTSSIRLQAVTPTANHIGLQVENSNTADSFGMVVKGGNDANDYTADFRKRDNTNIMRIRGDGRVGIGTSSPAAPLHLKTAENNSAIFESNHSTGTQFFIRNSNATTGTSILLGFAPANNISGSYIESVANEDFSTSANRTANMMFYTRKDGNYYQRLYMDDADIVFNNQGRDTDFRIESVNNTHMLFVDAGSNEVGIGTSDPRSPLHVQTSHSSTDVTAANTNSTLSIGNSATGNGVYNAIKFAANQQDMYIMSFNNAQVADRRLGFFLGSTAGDAVADERLSIRGNGNVGINNTSPSATLTIANNNVSHTTLTVTPPGSGDQPVAEIARGSGSHKGSGLKIAGNNYTNGSNTNAAMLEIAAGSYSGSGTNYIKAYDNTGTDFVVRGDGNVGIGTSSPSSMLEVTGLIRTNYSGVFNMTSWGGSGFIGSGPYGGPMFRSAHISASGSGGVNRDFLNLYTSGHWGQGVVLKINVITTYYGAGIREYWVDFPRGASTPTITEVNHKGSEADLYIDYHNATNLTSGGHSGQTVRRVTIRLRTGGAHRGGYATVEVVQNGPGRVWDSENSVSTVDTWANTNGSALHFTNIRVDNNNSLYPRRNGP